MRLTQEIIAAKRDGAELPDADIRQIVAGLTDGSVSEGQAAAFAMAVFFRDMTREGARRADARHARFRHGAELGRPAGPRPRQAFDRRRRRYGQPAAGARRSRPAAAMCR